MAWIFTGGTSLVWIALFCAWPEKGVRLLSFELVFTLIPLAIISGCLGNRAQQLPLLWLRVAACTAPLLPAFATIVAWQLWESSSSGSVLRTFSDFALLGACGTAVVCIPIAERILTREHRGRVVWSPFAFWVACRGLIALHALIGIAVILGESAERSGGG